MFLVDHPSIEPISDQKFELTLYRRDFNGSEDKIYSGGTIRNFLSNGREFSLTYNNAKKASTTFTGATIATGGTDIEAIFFNNEVIPGDFRFGLGLSYSDTGGRPKRTHVTLNASKHYENEGMHTWFSASAIAGGSWLASANAGAELSLGTAKGFIELGIPFAGNNTVSTASGKGIQLPLYGIGLRASSGAYFYELAYTNRLGTTTGMAMTPSIDNRGALSISVGVRF